MFYSSKNIFAMLIAATAFYGCSQHEDFETSTNVAENETTNVVFRLTTYASSSDTRSAEDSYSYEQGTAEEYKVNNARVYLYDSPTKLFVKSVLLTDLTRTYRDNDGYIEYEAERVSVPQGTFDIFVVANTDQFINRKTESEFLASIDSTTYKQARIEDISKGIVMTNRANENAGVVIVKKEDSTEDNVVSITLERVLARIDVAKGSETFQLANDKKQLYASVTLDGFHIVNLPKYFYNYRHTAVVTSMEEPEWNIRENFGNVKDVNGYVIDPYFFQKDIDASNFRDADSYYVNFFGDFSSTTFRNWTAFKSNSQYSTIYSLENCTLAPAQKNGYSTGLVFRGKIEPYNNVYTLNTNGNLTLITDKTRYPEVLYYYKFNFYDTPQALATAVGGGTSGNTLDLHQARKFEKSDDGNYYCYYLYWIRHLDNNNPTFMGVMEFAIVRNNLYKICVTNVSEIGTPDVPVNTDTPDEGETNLKVVLNVKPWIVRNQTDVVL